MPKVSVVIPNYNHARFLRKRIDSVLQQTFQDFEVILLDDCSTDDSRSILSSYAADPRIRIEFNDANSGSTFKQWNKGVRIARGEYIWIAESDDYADPHFLERLVAVLDSKPEVVFVSCRSWRATADGQLDGYADSRLAYLAHYATGAEVDGRKQCQSHFVRCSAVWSASSVLLRRAAYEHIGGADETFRLCGEWKAWAAMAQAGRVAYLSEPLNYHRVHNATVTAHVTTQSRRDALVQAEYLRVVRWMLGKVTPTQAASDELHRDLPSMWAPAVTVLHVPFGRRCSILRDAIAIDPAGTLRRLIPVWLTAVRLKFLRHWHSLRSASKTT